MSNIWERKSLTRRTNLRYMNVNNPSVSFIIPFYGSVALLKRALDSLVAQTDGDFEAIIVDDCSPESGEQLVGSYGNRFHYIRQPRNRSLFQARLCGARMMQGAYMVALDSDDYVMPDLVRQLKSAINIDNPDVIIYNVEQDDNGCVTPHWCRYASETIDSTTFLDKMVKKQLQWNVWSKAIRRDVWQNAFESGFQTDAYINASEDFCITMSLLPLIKKIKIIPYRGYRYCQNDVSLTSLSLSPIRAIRSIIQTMRARSVICQQIQRHEMPEADKSIVSSIFWMIIAWWLSEYNRAIKGVIKRVFARVSE